MSEIPDVVREAQRRCSGDAIYSFPWTILTVLTIRTPERRSSSSIWSLSPSGLMLPGVGRCEPGVGRILSHGLSRPYRDDMRVRQRGRDSKPEREKR